MIGSEQSVNFLVEGLALFRFHLSRLLLHWFDLRIDREPVADDEQMNSWHICGYHVNTSRLLDNNSLNRTFSSAERFAPIQRAHFGCVSR